MSGGKVLHAKTAGHGRWREILASQGIEVPAKNSTHAPCPLCGGKDRFRFDDKRRRPGDGGYICSQCGAGDSLNLLTNYLSISPGEAAGIVLNYTGASHQATPAANDVTRDFDIIPNDQTREQQLKTGVKAEKILKACTEAESPYLESKGLPLIGLINKQGAQVIPYYRQTSDGEELAQCQTLPVKGAKRFLSGTGTKKGTYNLLKGTKKTVFIAEGYATAATAHHLTDATAYTAADAGNLPSVVATAAKQHSGARLVVLVDKDEAGREALAKAQEVAACIGIEPPATAKSSKAKGFDWNDYFRESGKEATLNAINTAIEEQQLPPQPEQQIPPQPEPMACQEEVPAKIVHGFISFKSGVLSKLQRFCFERSLYPDLDFSGFTALTALAAVVGHKYKTPTRLKTNLYSIAAVGTGAGKDALKDSIKEILYVSGLERREVSFGSSRQGLHSELQGKEIGEVIRTNKLEGEAASKQAIKLMEEGKGAPTTTIIIKDEIHEALDTATSPSRAEMANLLLEAYTEKRKLMPLKAMGEKYLPLTAPHLNIFGITTPGQLAEKLNAGTAASGLIGRAMVYTTTYTPVKDYEVFDRDQDLCPLLASDLKKIARNHDQLAVEWGNGGFDRWMELDKSVIEPLKHHANHTIAQISGRLSEHVLRIAALIAISETPNKPAITPENINHAWAIREGLHNGFMQAMEAEGGIGASEHARIEARTLGAIQRHVAGGKGKTISHSMLGKLCSPFKNLKARDQDEVIRSLVNQGVIAEHTHGRGKAYELLKGVFVS